MRISRAVTVTASSVVRSMSRAIPRLAVFILLASITALIACENVTGPLGMAGTSPGPMFAISDGAHAGNPHFYFLPPLVPAPNPNGTFDGSLSPEVRICVWDGSDCGATLAVFDANSGPGSETVHVSASHYVANWHADEVLENYTLEAGETFRVRVLVAGQLLGSADLDVVGNGNELKNVDTDESIPLLDGQTLPIKFRIEMGALAVREIASAGSRHSCAVASDGQGYCWGKNRFGELGRGSTGGNFNTPQLVAGGLTWQSVQAAADHTCGHTTDGQMYCWGLNENGKLGIGYTDSAVHPTPEAVVGGHSFQSLASLGSAQGHASCGVTTAGDMYCWGSNHVGQLGNGSANVGEPTPVLVLGGHTFAGPVAMSNHTICALTTDGDILCWGWNDFGQLGRGTVTNFETTPMAVVGGHRFGSLALSGHSACGISTSGAAMCWGRNDWGELGIGSISGDFDIHPTPEVVIGGHTFTQLSGGRGFNCGVRSDGAALCWGINNGGQLGRGFTSWTEPTPTLVIGSHTFQSIGAGWLHTCGVTTTGDTFCWGRNPFGELGNGTFSNSPSPVFAIDLGP